MTEANLIWDSSSLGKRYVPEIGSDVVASLFGLQLPMISGYLCYAEVASIVNRSRNRGQISDKEFNRARLAMEDEWISDLSRTMLSVTNDDLLASIPLADRHNLNSNDGVLLLIFRNYVQQSSNRCILVVADKRFERAAMAEGIECLNPEMVSVADLAAIRLTSAPT